MTAKKNKCPTGYQLAAHENQSCNCAQDPHQDPNYDFTDREFYDAVYTILVDEAGAPAGLDDREIFIRAYCEVDHPATEYRFGGLLGFGGKFWRAYDSFYITAYREDETPKTIAIRENVNVLLEKAMDKYQPRMR